ncbi:MarR family winged helix-turn-helix transcriptional regulator [Amycolatopsis sp.]|uniref:MarR family winged helix-turn-helix transcriptional regulator n=1 Tax=Amycolatopsis sp. TaxID=37632 RepID=UPI002DF8036E|nr:MarR family transcriptional regulator [Amycolatopsis sp.]
MTDPRWLDETQQRAWRKYMSMQAQLNARLNRQLQADSKLSLSDFEVLVQLTDNPSHKVRMFEVAQALQWEKSRLSHHLVRMQKRGLVAREECPSDARGAFIVLTPEGRTAIEEAAPQHVDTVRRLFFEGMTEEQISTLATMSEAILKRLAAEED